MNLFIENKDKIDLSSFCNWLISYMQENSVAFVDSNKLTTYDNLLSSSINWLYTERIMKAINLYKSSFFILKWKQVGDSFEIIFDENINIPNSNTRYIDMIKLINFGNLSIGGCHIYDKFMEKIAVDLPIYYDMYLEENT